MPRAASSSATPCNSRGGRISTRNRSGADFLILSAHKFGGPKGAGALIAAREGLSVGLPLLRGGGQERGARAGTENVAGLAGFGAAAKAVAAGPRRPRRARLAALRDRLESADS